MASVWLTKLELTKSSFHVQAPSTCIVTFLQISAMQFYLQIRSLQLLKFNQNCLRYFRENRHLVFMAHLKGPTFGDGKFIFTRHWLMTDKLINVKYKFNLSDCSVASKAHIHPHIQANSIPNTTFLEPRTCKSTKSQDQFLPPSQHFVIYTTISES